MLVHGTIDADYEDKPTAQELSTLRRVAGKIPVEAYMICSVELAERASYYGVSTLISNFVNRPMPVGGNGYGAPPRGDQQTAGALGMGTVKANAVNQSFSMLAYGLPLFFGYIGDAYVGRFKLICYGILVFGIAHVLMVGAAAPSLLASGATKAPYFISVYLLSVGTGKRIFPTQFILVLIQSSQVYSNQTSRRYLWIRTLILYPRSRFSNLAKRSLLTRSHLQREL